MTVAIAVHQPGALLGAGLFMVVGVFMLRFPRRWLGGYTRFLFRREVTRFERSASRIGVGCLGVLFVGAGLLLGAVSFLPAPELSPSSEESPAESDAVRGTADAQGLHPWPAVLAGVILLIMLAMPFLLRRGIISLRTPARRALYEYVFYPGMGLAFIACIWLSAKYRPDTSPGSLFVPGVIAFVVLLIAVLLFTFLAGQWRGRG